MALMTAAREMSDCGSITVRLTQWRKGDRSAFDELVPLIYEDLRSIARQQLSRLRPSDTLNTTALVHESYAKLRSSGQIEFGDRQHFFAVAACAMRQIIVDHARSLMTDKRSGQKVPIDLERTPDTVEQRIGQVVFVDQLLERLEQINADLVRLVECRFYAGYTQEETARALGVSRSTVNRQWRQANAWLRELAGA